MADHGKLVLHPGIPFRVIGEEFSSWARSDDRVYWMYSIEERRRATAKRAVRNPERTSGMKD